MIYSHSQLSTYEQCPHKYKVRYIDKIKPHIPDTIETFLGSRVHETLEKLYKDINSKKQTTLKELLQYYHSQWKQNWSEHVLIVKQTSTQNHYKKMGEDYIKKYYEHYFPFDQGETIAIEHRILINLDEQGKYKLQGYIDRISKPKNGCYVIHDYKTSSRLPTQKRIQQDRQLALYALGVKDQYHDVKDINLTWHFLKFNKEITSKRTEKELEKLKKETLKLIQRIESTTTFPPKPSILCNWCEYKPICPQWSRLFILNEKPENEYTAHPAANLVDQYANLKRKRNQMTLDTFAELETLKKAIIDHAEKNNLDVIQGRKNQIQIIIQTQKINGKSRKIKEIHLTRKKRQQRR